jgi:hypothetical protein
MNKDANRVGIWGGSGSGKSTRLKELLKGDNRQIILDPLDDWRHEKGYKSVKTLKQLYKELKKNWNKGFKIVVRVDIAISDTVQILDELSKSLLIIQKPYSDKKDKRKITLVVDEMADFYPNQGLKMQGHTFYALSRKGRHYGVNIFGASQRLAEVHTSFRGNARENYFFRQDEAIDVQRALSSLGTQYKAQLLALKDHHYLHKIQGDVKTGKNKCNFK